MRLIFLIYLILFTALSWGKIEDNSFILEEAYNQEAGVYQFIQRYEQVASDYLYVFTNEIPITDKTHQVSYDVVSTNIVEERLYSYGELHLNYRWHPYNKNGNLVAMRLGSLNPLNGKPRTNTGFETVIAATFELYPKWVNHYNLGYQTFPNVTEPTKQTLKDNLRAGTSFIYLLKEDFNLMLETLFVVKKFLESTDEVTEQSLIINPGVRFAWELAWKKTQIVPGLSMPMTFSKFKPEYGVLLYLSFEPDFN